MADPGKRPGEPTMHPPPPPIFSGQPEKKICGDLFGLIESLFSFLRYSKNGEGYPLLAKLSTGKFSNYCASNSMVLVNFNLLSLINIIAYSKLIWHWVASQVQGCL